MSFFSCQTITVLSKQTTAAWLTASNFGWKIADKKYADIQNPWQDTFTQKILLLGCLAAVFWYSVTMINASEEIITFMLIMTLKKTYQPVSLSMDRWCRLIFLFYSNVHKGTFVDLILIASTGMSKRRACSDTNGAGRPWESVAKIAHRRWLSSPG